MVPGKLKIYVVNQPFKDTQSVILPKELSYHTPHKPPEGESSDEVSGSRRSVSASSAYSDDKRSRGESSNDEDTEYWTPGAKTKETPTTIRSRRPQEPAVPVLCD